MKIVCAPDSFKESLTARQFIDLLTVAAQEIFPGCQVVGLPMADGGEGTRAALSAALPGWEVSLPVRDPLGRTVMAQYSRLAGDIAIIETAAAIGLPLLAPSERDPLQASSFGAGQMLRHALEQGCRRVYLTVGGSATNDGGSGALAALGARFFDQEGNSLSPSGANLAAVHALDLSGLFSMAGAELTVLCDVDNPLLGASGATLVYGRQKGGDAATLAQLEAGMSNYAAVVSRTLGQDLSAEAGMGAAGGLSWALAAFCRANLQPGAEAVMELIGFDRQLRDADLVITGEGRLDGQTANGKVIYAVCRRCQAQGIPVVAIVGSLAAEAGDTAGWGLRSVMPLVSRPMPLSEALEQAPALFADAARRTLSMLRVGMEL